VRRRVKNLDIKILDEYDGGMSAPGSPSPQDDVDRLITAWQRERPDMDVSPMHVLSRVTRLALHLDRARRLAFAEHNLESSEFDVLSALRRAGAPYQLSPGHLVHETLVTSGTMTNRVDRLVTKGLVERLPDPDDRRGVQVRLTSTGRTAVDGALDALLDREKQLLAGLDQRQSAAVADALRTLSLPFDR
jgi:DNA-binding MarR family transcriptional regulator